jgi:hypothetical protein
MSARSNKVHRAIWQQWLRPLNHRMSENARMGIFDAAALAWAFFHSIKGDRQAA